MGTFTRKDNYYITQERDFIFESRDEYCVLEAVVRFHKVNWRE